MISILIYCDYRYIICVPELLIICSTQAKMVLLPLTLNDLFKNHFKERTLDQKSLFNNTLLLWISSARLNKYHILHVNNSNQNVSYLVSERGLIRHSHVDAVRVAVSPRAAEYLLQLASQKGTGLSAVILHSAAHECYLLCFLLKRQLVPANYIQMCAC